MTLFDPGPAAAPAEVLSADRRRTIRNAELLAAGVHPATKRPLLDGDGCCGSCAHHVAIGWHNRTWHKCEKHRLGTSHSASSDIRLSWPACVLYEGDAS